MSQGFFSTLKTVVPYIRGLLRGHAEVGGCDAAARLSHSSYHVSGKPHTANLTGKEFRRELGTRHRLKPLL